MRRREFIALFGTASLGWPIRVQAQPEGKVHRVALIFTTAPVSEMAGPDPDHPLVKAFLESLRVLGYIEGKNLVLERRSAEGRLGRLGEIVAELVRGGVDVLATVGNHMAQEAKKITSTVPIVMTTSIDPVAAGIVASLARPGGNITGLTNNPGPEFEAKRLEVLRDVLPNASRVAYLGTADDWASDEGKAVRAAVQTMGMTLIHAPQTPTHYADAFAVISRDQPHALFVARNPANYANRKLIVSFAIEHRIPGMYPYRELADTGGLLSYGVNVPDLFRRAAGYVDKILKGAKPGELPVEQPTKFELVINLKTAKALGLTVPPSLLARADEVIE